MLDFAACPPGIWIDALEEAGHDVEGLRLWESWGCFTVTAQDSWLVLYNQGQSLAGHFEYDMNAAGNGWEWDESVINGPDRFLGKHGDRHPYAGDGDANPL